MMVMKRALATAGLTLTLCVLTPSLSWAQLAITTTSCPSGTQSTLYAGCTISATGGTPPYTFSVDKSGTYAPLPEGMTLNAFTGVVTSSQIGGEGGYTVGFIVNDSAKDT